MLLPSISTVGPISRVMSTRYGIGNACNTHSILLLMHAFKVSGINMHACIKSYLVMQQRLYTMDNRPDTLNQDV